MKTDKELLELAAKSAGFSLVFGGPDGDMPRISGCLTSWNPLNNDGDALRLAVKADIQRVFSGGAEHGAMCYMEKTEPCPYAATRRAIVRAAAAIGEKL